MTHRTADDILSRIRASEDSRGARYFSLLLGDDQSIYAVSYSGMGETLARRLSSEDVLLVQQLIERRAVVVDRSQGQTYPLLEIVNRDGESNEVYSGASATGFPVRIVR